MWSNAIPILFAIVATAALAPSAAAQTPEMIEKVQRELTIRRLQGVWVPDLLVTAEGAEKYPLDGRKLFFDDGHFGRSEGKRVVASGTFAVVNGFLTLTVTDRAPWDLEATIPGRTGQEKVRYAFNVDGDLLTLCYATGNQGKADDLTPGKGRQVVVYKRQPTEGEPNPGRRRK